MDYDVLKLLKFLYENRYTWFTEMELLKAGFALAPPDFQWLLENKILSSVNTKPVRYRITIGGIMEYTRYTKYIAETRFNKQIALVALFVSVASLIVSLLSA